MSDDLTEQLRAQRQIEWTLALSELSPLLPCPWCGALPSVYLAWIGCENRDCPFPAKAMELISLYDDFRPAAKRMHARWNTRPAVVAPARSAETPS